MTHALMSQYVHWSGDVAGVVVDASGARAAYYAGATGRKWGKDKVWKSPEFWRGPIPFGKFMAYRRTSKLFFFVCLFLFTFSWTFWNFIGFWWKISFGGPNGGRGQMKGSMKRMNKYWRGIINLATWNSSRNVAAIVRFSKNEGNMVGKCFDKYFWYSPGCRTDPGTCFTWLTAGSWGLNEAMLKATVYNMPMAVAVAKTFANWASMPLVHDMVLYWWVPDSTFLRPALKVFSASVKKSGSQHTHR